MAEAAGADVAARIDWIESDLATWTAAPGHYDPSTGAATAAANQVQVSVEAARAALDAQVWELLIAEERPRAVAGTGVDAVIRARRRTRVDGRS